MPVTLVFTYYSKCPVCSTIYRIYISLKESKPLTIQALFTDLLKTIVNLLNVFHEFRVLPAKSAKMV